MGIFDWLIILFLVYLLWRGWRKGFIGMLLHLIGVILVFFLIAHYFPLVKHGIMVKLHWGALLSTIMAVVLIVAMIALIVQIIRLILERAVKAMNMSFLNSAIGALLGFLTGLFLLVVLSILIDVVPYVSKRLENNDKHRVYAAVKVVRTEIYSAFKMKDKIAAIEDSTKAKLPELPKLPKKKTK
jgi:membrane protein required for colicin V production